jgi:hypothetical protein
LNLPLSAIAVVFVGALGLEDMMSNWSLIFMISLPILSVKEVVLLFLQRLLYNWWAPTQGYPLCKGVFPSSCLGEDYIYGEMAPSFDFVVVIGESSA